MDTPIKVPAVGESITEVTIGSWLKADGDFVSLDETICELESDKASFELTAETEGILKIQAEEGDTLAIGDLVATITASEDQTQARKAPDAEETKKQSFAEEPAPVSTGEQVITMQVPAVGESITEVTISSWLKASGDMVALDEVICEIESDKASFELTAEASGQLETLAQEGDTINVGNPFCKITVLQGAVQKMDAPPQSRGQLQKVTQRYTDGHGSPAALKILTEKGISPAEVQGSGKAGRIIKEDALKAEKISNSEVNIPETTSTLVSSPSDRNTTRKRMSSLRKTIAKRLVSVKNETAMLTTFNEVNMKPIMTIRKKYKEKFKEKHDIGLGFMSFFTKAVCMALQEFPEVNAQIDKDEVVYSDFCDVSIAVSTPRGLVVPVIRNAESLSFDQIEKEIMQLALKARDNKLSIPEMTGGTFTITNGGIFGSMLSTPIINAPQSAILGMHNIVERPVAINGEITIKPIMYVALSYDHRVVDGKESVSFLVRVKGLLEDPTRLLLGV